MRILHEAEPALKINIFLVCRSIIICLITIFAAEMPANDSDPQRESNMGSSTKSDPGRKRPKKKKTPNAREPGAIGGHGAFTPTISPDL